MLGTQRIIKLKTATQIVCILFNLDISRTKSSYNKTEC